MAKLVSESEVLLGGLCWRDPQTEGCHRKIDSKLITDAQTSQKLRSWWFLNNRFCLPWLFGWVVDCLANLDFWNGATRWMGSMSRIWWQIAPPICGINVRSRDIQYIQKMGLRKTQLLTITRFKLVHTKTTGSQLLVPERSKPVKMGTST